MLPRHVQRASSCIGGPVFNATAKCVASSATLTAAARQDFAAGATRRSTAVRHPVLTGHGRQIHAVGGASVTRGQLSHLRGHPASSGCYPPRRHHGSHGDHDRLPMGASPEERRMSNLVVGVGLLADTAMTAAKAGVGAWSGSPALLSDAVHGLADMLVSVAVIVTRCAEACARALPSWGGNHSSFVICEISHATSHCLQVKLDGPA